MPGITEARGNCRVMLLPTTALQVSSLPEKEIRTVANIVNIANMKEFGTKKFSPVKLVMLLICFFFRGQGVVKKTLSYLVSSNQ